MTQRILPVLVFATLGLSSLLGCTTSRTANFDKNTNWLQSCTDSEACGPGLQCVCGVCTSVCDRDAQCAERDDAAICIPLTTMASACLEPATTSVCSLACADDASCSARSEALACTAGGCTLVEASPIDAGADAADMPPPDAEVDSGVQDSGGGDVALEATPEVVSAVGSACGAGYACDARAAALHSIGDIFASSDGFMYWTDWGSLDALDNHRIDGAILRIAKVGGTPEVAISGLDRPWRLWVDTEQYYWLSGEPREGGTGSGEHGLFEAPRDQSQAPREVLREVFAQPHFGANGLYWTASYDYRETGDSVQVRYCDLPEGGPIWSEYFIQGSYKLAGVDDTYVFLEDGALNIARGTVIGNLPEPFVSDTPAFAITVGEDALWLIHVGADDRPWVSSMSKETGAITHVGDAGAYHGRPKPGSTVVWIITAEPDANTWQLWSMPKSGGERELALTWPAVRSASRQEPDAPVWTTEADDAWVFAHGALVHVHRP